MTQADVASEAELKERFPEVDPQVKPFGSRVLVQYPRMKGRSAGGIILVDEVKDTEKWNTQTVKVVALGPLAFKNRDTQKDWPEGAWANPGEFVRAAKYGGDRWEVTVEGEKEPVLFALFNDLDLLGKVTGNPLKMKAYI